MKNKDINHSIHKNIDSDSSFVKIDENSSKTFPSKVINTDQFKSNYFNKITSNDNIRNSDSNNLKIHKKKKYTSKSIKNSTNDLISTSTVLQNMLNDICLIIFKDCELFSNEQKQENSFYFSVFQNCDKLDNSKFLELLFFLSSEQQQIW